MPGAPTPAPASSSAPPCAALRNLSAYNAADRERDQEGQKASGARDGGARRRPCPPHGREDTARRVTTERPRASALEALGDDLDELLALLHRQEGAGGGVQLEGLEIVEVVVEGLS